jgi:hypothetical protein
MDLFATAGTIMVEKDTTLTHAPFEDSLEMSGICRFKANSVNRSARRFQNAMTRTHSAVSGSIIRMQLTCLFPTYTSNAGTLEQAQIPALKRSLLLLLLLLSALNYSIFNYVLQH